MIDTAARTGRGPHALAEIGPAWGHFIVYTFLAGSVQLGVYHHLDHTVSASRACLGTLQAELAPFGAHGRRLP